MLEFLKRKWKKKVQNLFIFSSCHATHLDDLGLATVTSSKKSWSCE